MKKNIHKIFLILLFHSFLIAFTQEGKEFKMNISNINSKEIYEKVENTKSGNWKDVMTDFMQAAIKDITGDKKSFQYKASIFSIKAKADSTLLYDYNYTKETFSRNFQIGIGLNLDKDYKFRGFEYGFDWAIVNKRDLSIAKVSQDLHLFYVKSNSELINILNEHFNDFDTDELIYLKKAINIAMAKGQYIPRENLPAEFLKFLPKDYYEKSIAFEKQFEEEINNIKMRPLLTFGFHSNFNKESKFLSEYNATMVYLQGIKSKNGSKMEIDFRNQFKSKDSIVVSSIKRKEFSSQLGLNISILKSEDKSLIELKPNFEYQRIFSGVREDEKNNKFLANADLRIRVLKNLWVPLILKYDIETNNLFGFLNVSLNFDAMKKE